MPPRPSQHFRPLVLLCAFSLLTVLPTLLYLQWSSLAASASLPLSPNLSTHLAWLTQPINFPWQPLSSWGTGTGSGACPADPWQAPGMLHFGASVNATRWVPFPREPEAYEPGAWVDKIEELDVYWAGLTEGEMEDLGAPERLMMELKLGGGEWARGGSVLFIGDSHDRNNVQNFCAEVGGVHSSWGGHVGGVCTVERLDLTLVYWFLYGLPDQDFPWHASAEDPPKTPEGRIRELFLPQMEDDGLGQFVPDLMVVNSLFWDSDHLFDKYFSEFGIKRSAQEGLSFQEVRYHQQRASSLLRLLRTLYPSTPTMYRSRHLRASNDRGRIMRVFQLDQGWRAVCEALGVRVFDWGGKLEGYTEYVLRFCCRFLAGCIRDWHGVWGRC
ncbi:hypothetical protein CALCODRAFT_498385 [Calocera cornea HHB12733]|uniref:Proteophosphoglycan ppg4 n=1 Tax=Calocera cornea HHB12733 TaxID=1353952 RepID=A0A165EVY9_9BASI|nr:hypothetical protein CALCODRAFT_498385 [Calocera cornea HHB12733]